MTMVSLSRSSIVGVPEAAPMAMAALAGDFAALAAGPPICFTKPGEVDLCVYRGDSGRIRVVVTTPDGLPYDVSAATWDCDIRIAADEPTVVASLLIEPVPGQTNAVDMVLTPAQSQLLNTSYVYDLEMTLGGEVQTLIRGAVTVTKDVSRDV